MSFLIIIVNSYFIVGDKKIKISMKEHKKKRRLSFCVAICTYGVILINAIDETFN